MSAGLNDGPYLNGARRGHRLARSARHVTGVFASVAFVIAYVSQVIEKAGRLHPCRHTSTSGLNYCRHAFEADLDELEIGPVRPARKGETKGAATHG